MFAAHEPAPHDFLTGMSAPMQHAIGSYTFPLDGDGITHAVRG